MIPCNFDEYFLDKGMRIFFLIIFMLVASLSIHAEILKEVVVTGNKRTTKEAVIQHAQIKTGTEFSEEDRKAAVENLRRVHQFHLKKADFNNGILTIEIEDKWTLFPVPMITQSGKYYNRGLLIYEDNIFGSLGTFAPGVSWSNNNLNAILYYQDESLFTSNTGIKVLFLRKSELVEFKREDVPVHTHESFYNSVLITPNYLYKDHVFKAGPVFTDKKIRSETGTDIVRDKSTGLFFRHHWNAYQALDVMYEGLVTTYDFYIIKGGNGRWYLRQEADAKWSFPFDKNFLNLGLHGHSVNDRGYLFSKTIGGDEGYRGYDKLSVPATSNAGAMIQYQLHLFRSIFLSPFYEFNNTRLIEPSGGNTLNEHSVGLGLRYYFKKISIPAVIFDVSRNLNDRSNHYLLNIGASI